MNSYLESIAGLQRFRIYCFIALSFVLAPSGVSAQTTSLMDDDLLIADDFSTSVNQASLTTYNGNAQTGMLAALPYTVEGISSQSPVTTLYDADTNNVLILTRKVSGDAAGPVGFGYTYDFNKHTGYTVQVEMRRQSARWVSLVVGNSNCASQGGAGSFAVRFLDDGTLAVVRNGSSDTPLVFPVSTINEYDQFTAVRIQFENTAWDGTGTLTVKLFVNKTPTDESSWTQLDLGGAGGSYVRSGGFTANCVSFVSQHDANASVSYYRNPRIGFNRSNLYSISDADVSSFFMNPPNRFRLIQSGGHGTANIHKFPTYGIGNSLAFFYNLLYNILPNGPAAIDSRVDLNNANGFTPWLADDFYFPSGQAGGMVVEENPDWESRGITCLTATGTGTDPVTLDLPTDHSEEKFISAVIYPLVDGIPDVASGTVLAVQTNQVVTTGISGPWELCGFVQIILTNAAGQTADSFGTTGKYPDLMNDDAMESFLGYMHEGITDRITDFSSKVDGFYTNEPQLPHLRYPDRWYAKIPWTQDMFAAFEQQHGYSLEPKLLALYAGIDTESRRVRMHFRQTIAELMSDRYARKIREWCEIRGIASTGHPLLEESLLAQVGIYGDLMKFQSEFSYPAQDIGIPNPSNYATFDYRRTRFMSSVAAWKQRDRAVLFLDPIVDGGGSNRLSPAVPLMKNAANNGFLNGANAFHTIVVLDASTDGSAAGYTTNEYQALNEYIGRIAVLLRGARRETSVALYYPIAEMQSAYVPSTSAWTVDKALHQSLQDNWTATGDALLNADIDYTIVHPDAVGEAAVANGVMNIGYGSYRYLVMPQINGFLPKQVLDKITEFESGGGTVLWVDNRPLRATYAEDDAAVSNALKNVTTVTQSALPGQIGSDVYADAFKLTFTPTVKTQLEVARFTRQNRRIYYLVNRTDESLTVTANASAVVTVEICNPVTGTISAPTSITTSSQFVLGGSESLLLLECDDDIEESTLTSNTYAYAAVLHANLGYDSAGGTNQLAITKDAGLDNAVFTDVTRGSHVTANTQAGVATSFGNAYTPDCDGSRGYQHWDLTGSGGRANVALNTGHYLEFALTLDSADVESLDSVTINGVASIASVDNFALMLSTNNFETRSEVTRKQLPWITGGQTGDATDPWTGYGDVTYTLGSPIVLDEGTTIFSFKLAIAEDGLGNARAIALNSIRFGVTIRAYDGPAPVSQITMADGGRIEISWEGGDYATYTVQYKENLLDAAWSNVIAGMVGINTLSVTNDIAAPQAFYRVIFERP